MRSCVIRYQCQECGVAQVQSTCERKSGTYAPSSKHKQIFNIHHKACHVAAVRLFHMLRRTTALFPAAG